MSKITELKLKIKDLILKIKNNIKDNNNKCSKIIMKIR